MLHWHFMAYILPLLVAIVVATALAFLAWQRNTTGARILAALMLVTGLWSLGYALELTAVELSTKVFWAKFQYLFIVTVPVLWLILALHFTRRVEWLTRRYLSLLSVIPLITLLLVWTNEAHGLIWRRVELDSNGPLTFLKVTYGLWFGFHWFFSYIALLLGTLLLVRMLFRSRHLYRSQTGILLLGVLFPWLGNGVYLLKLGPLPNLDLTPFTIILSGLLMGWGFYRYRLLEITPVARGAVVEMMGAGVVVLDRRQRVIDLNPAAQRILGCNAIETVGLTSAEVFGRWPALIEQCQSLNETYLEFASTGETGHQYFEAHLSPLYDRRTKFDGCLVVLRDITQRKLIERALRESEEKFRILAETTTAAIVIHQGAKFLYVNSAAEGISGYNRVELLNMEFWQIVHPDFQDVVRQRAVARLEGKPVLPHYEVKMLDKNGQEKWVYLTTGVLEFQGKPTVLATIFDITKLKQTETALSQARDQALEASRLKTQLLANVSHDLRTPLNAILGYTEMLQEGVYGPLSTQQQLATQEIIESTGQLLNFVNNLLGQAQIEAGKVSLHISSFALTALIENLQALTGPLIQNKAIKVTYQIDEDVPAVLLGDPYWLQQILINLVGNAIKFTEQGTVAVFFSRPNPEHWAIDVADTGLGIPSEAQAHIFNAFWQIDGTTTREHGGSGLGLSIVKELTTLMGGQISLKSEPGIGSVFTVLLPISPIQERTA